MLILICNIGSTSFKCQLLDMRKESVLFKGSTERVGSTKASITYTRNGETVLKTTASVSSHREAVKHLLDFLNNTTLPGMDSLEEISGIGFKTIQAGDMNGTVFLEDQVLQAMEDYRELAPAHNPPYLSAIYMFRELLPDTPLVGVFEPGFHLHIPEYARIYGTPWEWYEKHGVKKYGYHGASHRYVTAETVRILHLPGDNHKVITCHLGGSSSLCAYKNGKSIDTSMGFTPQSGLIQGNRTGDLDPYVLPYIMNKKGISLEEALSECSKNGGLRGISGISADMRDINQTMAEGNKRAGLARDKFIYDIKRYIGEFLIVLEGLDAICFTGGIGQKDAGLRHTVLSSLSFLGMKLDITKNLGHETIISAEDSLIKSLVLETNEELVVARETQKLIECHSSSQ